MAFDCNDGCCGWLCCSIFNGFCGGLLMTVVVVVVFFWIFVLRWVVAATMVEDGCCEFLWEKFYFILVSYVLLF